MNHSEYQQRVRHAELRALGAQAEADYLKDQIQRLLHERRIVDDLETHIAELQQTIADQSRLVDERDVYIRSLEARVQHLESLAEDVSELREMLATQARQMEVVLSRTDNVFVRAAKRLLRMLGLRRAGGSGQSAGHAKNEG